MRSRFFTLILVLVLLAGPAWASDTGNRGPAGGGLEDALKELGPTNPDLDKAEAEAQEAAFQRQAEIANLEEALDPETGLPKTIRELRTLEGDQPWAEGVRRSLENARRELRKRLERLRDEQKQFEKQRRARAEDDPHKKIPTSRIERGTSFEPGDGDEENAVFSPNGAVHADPGCGPK